MWTKWFFFIFFFQWYTASPLLFCNRCQKFYNVFHEPLLIGFIHGFNSSIWSFKLSNRPNFHTVHIFNYQRGRILGSHLMWLLERLIYKTLFAINFCTCALSVCFLIWFDKVVIISFLSFLEWIFRDHEKKWYALHKKFSNEFDCSFYFSVHAQTDSKFNGKIMRWDEENQITWIEYYAQCDWQNALCLQNDRWANEH